MGHVFVEMASGQTELLLNAALNYARWHSANHKLPLAAVLSQRDALQRTIDLLESPTAQKFDPNFDARVLLPAYHLLLLGTQGIIDKKDSDSLPAPKEIEDLLETPEIETWCNRYPATEEAAHWRLALDISDPLEWPTEEELVTIIEQGKPQKPVKKESRPKAQLPQKTAKTPKATQPVEINLGISRAFKTLFDEPFDTVKWLLFIAFMIWLLVQGNLL